MTIAARSLWQGLILVALLAVASLLGLLAFARHTAQAPELAHLATAHGISVHLRADRLALLRVRTDALAEDPSFVDYMAQSLIPNPARGNAIDKASIADLLSQRRHGYDLAMVLDPNGKEAAASGLSLRSAAALERDPMVKQVIATQKPMHGLWVDDGRLLQVVIEPLLRGGALQGLLLTAQRLDGGFVSAVSALARTNVALLVRPRPTSRPVLVNNATPWMQAALDALRMPQQLPGNGQAIRLQANGHAARVWISPINATEGTAALVVFAPRASIPVYAGIWPVLLGVLVLALIGFAAVLWHWRRVAAPMQVISEIIERGARGDHNLCARVEGNPGIRRLRDAVNQWFAREQATDAAGGRPRTRD